MANIFGNSYQATESWTAQGAVVTWFLGAAPVMAVTDIDGNTYGGSDLLIPLLMQQITLQFQRSIQSFWPLNQSMNSTLKKCNITGAPRGTFTVQGIYAPTSSELSDFLEACSAPCKPESKQVSILLHPYGAGNCKSAEGTIATYTDQKFMMLGVELETFGFQMQGGEAAVSYMPLTFSFTNLEFDNTNGDMRFNRG